MENIIWILIPLAPFLLGGFAVWTKHQQKVAEMQVSSTAEATAEKAAQYSSHVAKLEQRVQTLERIVTDRGYDIATQIEALRDERIVEQQGGGMPLSAFNRGRV